MKLLFDENLSPELVEALGDTYPDSQHVHERGLGASDDRDLWEYAKSFGFVIVTKDSDFYERSMRMGAPPKVVWLRLGNCTTAAVAMLLRNSEQTLLRFAGSEERLSSVWAAVTCTLNPANPCLKARPGPPAPYGRVSVELLP